MIWPCDPPSWRRTGVVRIDVARVRGGRESWDFSDPCGINRGWIWFQGSSAALSLMGVLVRDAGSGTGERGCCCGAGMTMLNCDRWGRPGVHVVLSDSTITAISWMGGSGGASDHLPYLFSICRLLGDLLASPGHSLHCIQAIRGLPRCLRGDQIDVGTVYHCFVISRLAGYQILKMPS